MRVHFLQLFQHGVLTDEMAASIKTAPAAQTDPGKGADIHRVRVAFDRDALIATVRLTPDRFRAPAEHQIEPSLFERLRCHRPTRLFRFVRERAEQFHMQGDRFRYPVHGKIAENVAALRPRLLHAAALENDFGKFLHVKKFRAAQVIVAFHDPSVDAAHINSRRMDFRCSRSMSILPSIPANFPRPRNGDGSHYRAIDRVLCARSPAQMIRGKIEPSSNRSKFIVPRISVGASPAELNSFCRLDRVSPYRPR